MRRTWRWFGPDDPIGIDDIRQTGAEGVVSALHHLPPGQAWSVGEIQRRQAEIAEGANGPTGSAWDVVESLPVSEAIKTQGPETAAHIAAYRESLANLAQCGIRTVCYNFMPVLDWTRTELAERRPNGATAMRFDLVDFAMFDLHVLARPNATDDYGDEIKEASARRFADTPDERRRALADDVLAGLPGAAERWSVADLPAHLAQYAAIDAPRLRANLIDFLAEVAPTAEALGVRLCCHPDDPPFPLLGLPRVMSSEDDYAAVLNAVDTPANGATLCTGSLGVARAFDPVGFVDRLGPKIHFVHLRNTRRDGPVDGDRVSFFESEHLDGDTDLVATLRALLAEERRRRAEGRPDADIPMRPDHGQAILDDLSRASTPGYPLYGRMRAMGELSGAIQALEAADGGGAPDKEGRK